MLLYCQYEIGSAPFSVSNMTANVIESFQIVGLKSPLLFLWIDGVSGKI